MYRCVLLELRGFAGDPKMGDNESAKVECVRTTSRVWMDGRSTMHSALLSIAGVPNGSQLGLE